MSRKNKQDRQAKPVRALLSALSRWQELDTSRKGFLLRVENYAAVTIPKVCLPEGINQVTESIQHDWQSVGAQAVNHLLNKLMLAMFSPSQPFFRLDPNKQLADKLASQNISEADLRTALVGGEQRAIRILDQRAVRPKLYESLKHLIITGNALLDRTDNEAIRIFGLKRYVVKRSVSGRPIEILIHEKVLFDELEQDVQDAVPHKAPDAEVNFIRWYKWADKKWSLTQHVDSHDLGEAFAHDYSEDDFPIHPLVWDLADEHDYGTGLVEDYAGDFGTLSTLSEAEVKAAILSSDYRWLANPSGITSIEDFKKSDTGDVLAGKKDDLMIVSLGVPGAMEQIGKAAEKYIRRIGMAFLLGSAVTRDAERVTAEEIRMQATELETALGGVYSRLSVDLQLPLVRWLLKSIKIDISGTSLEPTITTGLAALSRSADAQQLVLFLQDLTAIATMPPDVQIRLNLNEAMSTLAAARGLATNRYIRPEAEVKADIAKQQQQQQDAAAKQAVVEQGAKAAAQAPAQ